MALFLALLIGAAVPAFPVQKKRMKMSDVVWGKASEGLALGLSSPKNDVVRLHLKNAGSRDLSVWDRVEAEETHLDWFALRVEGENTHRTVRLSDAREQSAAMDAALKPGETLHHDVNVADWAGRERNGGKPLAAGTYRVWATYEVKKDDKHWRGHLEAGPVNLTITPKAGAKH